MITFLEFFYSIFNGEFLTKNRYLISEKYKISYNYLIVLFHFLVGNKKDILHIYGLDTQEDFDTLDGTKHLFKALKDVGINPTDNLLYLFNEYKLYEAAAIIMQAAHDVYGERDPEKIDLL